MRTASLITRDTNVTSNMNETSEMNKMRKRQERDEGEPGKRHAIERKSDKQRESANKDK